MTGNARPTSTSSATATRSASRRARSCSRCSAIFVESSLGDKRQDTQTAVKFLDDQIKRYEEILLAAEDVSRISAQVPRRRGQGGAGFLRSDRRACARRSRRRASSCRSAEQSRDAYKRESPVSRRRSSRTRPTSASSARRPGDRRAYRGAEAGTRRHCGANTPTSIPTSLATQRLIEQLEEQRTAELEARRKAASGRGRRGQCRRSSNPVFQQLRISLADAEAMSRRCARSSRARSQYQRAEGAGAACAAGRGRICAAQPRLRHAEEDLRALLARRESAAMGKDVQDAGGAQFRVIDPPRVSPEPVAPRPMALLGCVRGARSRRPFRKLRGEPDHADVPRRTHAARNHQAADSRAWYRCCRATMRRQRRRNAWLFAGGLAACSPRSLRCSRLRC